MPNPCFAPNDLNGPFRFNQPLIQQYGNSKCQ